MQSTDASGMPLENNMYFVNELVESQNTEHEDGNTLSGTVGLDTTMPGRPENEGGLGPKGLNYSEAGTSWMIARIFRMAMLKGEESGRSVGPLDTFPNMEQLKARQTQTEASSGMHYLNFWLMEGCIYLDHSLSGFQGAHLYLDAVLAHLTLKLDSMLEMDEEHARAEVLEQELIIFYMLRIGILATVESIDQLIEWGALVMSREPSYPVINTIVACLSHAGIEFLHRGLGEGGVDADMSIECHTRATTLIPESHPIMPSLLRSLGKSYHWRASNGTPPTEQVRADCAQAIQCYRAAIFLTPPQHEEFFDTLKGLGALLRKQIDQIKHLEDISFAIECASQITEIIPTEHPLLPSWFDTLAGFYQERFRLLFDQTDADQAIKYLNNAISLEPSDPDLLFELNLHLGIVHELRYQNVGKVQDFDVAIQYYKQAVLLVPEKFPSTSSHSSGSLLTVIGDAFWKKFIQLGDLSDLNVAMEYHYLALSQTPEGHPGRGNKLTKVGVTHLKRYECTGNPDDLTASLDWIHQALRVIPEDPEVLANLGACYAQKSQISGSPDDIDKGINYLGKALTLVPEESMRITALNNIGEAYRRRYMRLGNPDDLEQSMHHYTVAITRAEALEEPSQILPEILSNLGVAHADKYMLFEEQRDIDKAIQHLKRALSFSSQGPRKMSSMFVNLGVALTNRYNKLNNDQDINETIELLTDGLTHIPPESSARPVVLSNLGTAYLYRTEKYPNQEDIEAALSLLSQAVSSFPSEHSSMARMLNVLGKVHHAQFKYSGDTSSLHASSDHFSRAARHVTGRPLIRFEAAIRWARAASLYSTSENLQAYQTAMDLVPQLIWLGMTINQRYSQEGMQYVGDVTLEAAAVAISLEKYETALEWLEQGRSIVWGQTLQLRTPLDGLAAVYPSLAEDLTNIAHELHDVQSLGTDFSRALLTDPNKSPEMVTQRHRYLAKHYEETVREIRQKPGFESFLQPKRAAELLRIPQRGPVAVVNVHELRCDALILIPGKQEITHVALPSLSSQKAASCRARMESSHLNIRDRGVKKIDPFYEGKDGFQQILLELWEDVVKPVLDCLGYTTDAPHANTGNLPHITWCTTGALSFLPLHAAGHHNQLGARIFDYVISSYTPTLSSLIPKFTMSTKEKPRLLLVGQEYTPGYNPLPGTKEELARIRSCAQAHLSYTLLDGGKATTDAVLNAMEGHEWVHLACHAHQNSRNPLDSGFFLQDGTLSLLQISRKEFQGKGLAFLSACQTAKGDKELAEEAIHLASGMLMAGYPAVIATMWSVVDEDAPLVADAVYGELIENGQVDYQGAAKALHVAVGKLRERVGTDAFFRWVPYIHIGN